MTFAIHGLAVSRGIAIGRAVLVASSRVDVAHYFIETDQIEAETAAGGGQRQKDQRAGSQSLRIHDVAGGRRREGGIRAWSDG